MPLFDLARVRERLPNRAIDWFPTLDSTMNESARSGHIVVADEQTAGRGRHGRTWHSAAGAGLYVSIPLPLTPAPILMLALGLATREAIINATALVPDLRWPNDVLINSKKAAGVLAQVERDSIIAGIGINVSHTAFPPDLETPATSLLLEGATVSREDLLVQLIRAVDLFTALAPADVLAKFTEASTYASGRRICVNEIEAVTCGLDPSGFLRVREDSGTESTIFSGGVRPI